MRTMSTELVAAFQAAQTASNEARQRWNGAAVEDRTDALKAEMAGAADRARDAARALIADAAGRHHIEETATVYLRLGAEGRWVVDSPTTDGYPLEGYDDGPINEACEHDGGDDADAECDAVREAARCVDLPDAAAVLRLLTDALL